MYSYYTCVHCLILKLDPSNTHLCTVRPSSLTVQFLFLQNSYWTKLYCTCHLSDITPYLDCSRSVYFKDQSRYCCGHGRTVRILRPFLLYVPPLPVYCLLLLLNTQTLYGLWHFRARRCSISALPHHFSQCVDPTLIYSNLYPIHCDQKDRKVMSFRKYVLYVADSMTYGFLQ